MKKITATVLAHALALVIGTPAFAAEVAPAKAPRVDINTATEDQLKATLGVGDEDARRIVAARPYQKKDDLKTKEVVAADTFEKIKKLIDSVC